MTTPDRSVRIRATVLQALFQLLYTRLGFLHETTGRVAYGPAWNGRRRHVVPSRPNGMLIDLGCGEGRLLRSIHVADGVTIGIEPSAQMSRRASQHGVAVIRATAQSLPLADRCANHVVASYPGSWILDRRTWDEIARVTAPEATVDVLLGGDVTRGRGSAVRGWLMRLVYGRQQHDTGRLPPLGNANVSGDYVFLDDEWGTAILWRGTRDAGAT